MNHAKKNLSWQKFFIMVYTDTFDIEDMFRNKIETYG